MLSFHTVYSLRVVLGNQHTILQCHPNLRIPEVVPVLQTFIHSLTAELVCVSSSRAGRWSRLGSGGLHFLDKTNYPALLIISTRVPRLKSLSPSKMRMQACGAGTILGASKLGYSPFYGSSLLDTLKGNRRAEQKPHAAHSARAPNRLRPLQNSAKAPNLI